MMKAMVNETKRRSVIFNFDGHDLELILGLSAIADMQEEFGDLEKAFADMSINSLIKIATILINDAIEEHNEKFSPAWQRYSTREVGRLIGFDRAEELRDALFTVMGISLPDAEEEGNELTPEMQRLLEGETVEENPKN